MYRAFGLALHGVGQSKNPGHFGLLDWSGTPPSGVRIASYIGVLKSTPRDCTPGAGEPKRIAAFALHTP